MVASVQGVAHAGDPVLTRARLTTTYDLDRVLPAPTHHIGYVRVNRAAVETKSSPFWRTGSQLVVPLPAGGSVEVAIDESEMLDANRFTSRGHVVGEPESRVVFAYNEGFLSGSIETAARGYAIRPATETLTQIYEIDPALVPPCGGMLHPPRTGSTAGVTESRLPQAAVGNAGTTGGAAPVTAAATDPAQRPEIHVMMLYTQAVKTSLSGAARQSALQSEFDAVIAKMNNELAASQIVARVKLVAVAETQYDEQASLTSRVQSDALTALYKTTDGAMDEIHALRDQVGADVVCLVLNRSDSSSIGLSYVLDSPSAVDEGAAAQNPLYAFAVVQYTPLAGTDVFPHEMGHVLGCAHARGDPGATGTRDGAYTFSYGYRFFGADGRQYHDIMAYSPGSPLAYYSNPRVQVPAPVSAPIGIAAGQPGEADCALTIDEDAFEVSQYRLQMEAASAGTLINVATRAYVGTGDAVLIGGFFIDGTQPKRVLIRGAGPALAAYGVSGVLPNPQLRVVSNGTVVGSNDDWSVQAGAADVATAGGQVGAFPFGAGSLDAAVLVRLAPGGYSAVVEGVNGAAGSGLVEVYDVDRADNKIVNLATRGYADKGKEMFAGFVVQGTAGATKRILVRVLGPTLGRAPFNISGAMDDPLLELHNGTGELLLRNDDWSSGTTTGTNSPQNDFSPLIKSYSEKQIAATGFAPSNRREPAVMVDLPPGNYSVIAQPFEDLSGTTPQPAKPGVAIVEVYEITP